MKGKKASAAAALKDEADKLSTKSESDSEPDRRRSTRGAARASSNIDKTPEVTERKRRSNNSTPVDSKLSNESEKKESAATTKNSSIKNNEVESVKLSEMEDVDVINSPQSSTASDETYNNTDNEKTDSSPKSNIGKYKIGSKISVRYGTGKNQRTYLAKILEVDRDDGGVVYYIHYNGWNHR